MRSDGEEQRVMEILDRLRTEVKHRGLLLKTFFDDFDKVRMLFQLSHALT